MEVSSLNNCNCCDTNDCDDVFGLSLVIECILSVNDCYIEIWAECKGIIFKAVNNS